MRKELFNDLVSAFEEAIAYERGEIELDTNLAEIPDEELEMEQAISQVVSRLPMESKIIALRQLEELLEMSS